jgi:hypothetical protein
MKKFRLLFFACLVMIAGITTAQKEDNTGSDDSTGLPGDNFSLQGALEMFKNAKTLEEFEQKLNTENNYVNNLDLDGDGNIDYVKVIDKSDGNVHAIILQVPVNEKEDQDIAVIEIEKTGDASAMLQILGDEDIYGDSTYVEPVELSENNSKDKSGPNAGILSYKSVIVNVWLWPCVKYIYAPGYVVWVSPWKYSYYPPWFKPWKPAPWYIHHKHCIPYHGYYHPVYIHRVVVVHKYYMPHRRTSVIVVNKYKPAHVKYKANHPYKTYKKPPPPPKKNNQPKNKPKPNNKPNKGNGPKPNKGGGGKK